VQEKEEMMRAADNEIEKPLPQRRITTQVPGKRKPKNPLFLKKKAAQLKTRKDETQKHGFSKTSRRLSTSTGVSHLLKSRRNGDLWTTSAVNRGKKGKKSGKLSKKKKKKEKLIIKKKRTQQREGCRGRGAG